MFLVLIGCSQVTGHIYGFQFGVFYMYKEGSTLKLIIAKVLGDDLKYEALKSVEVLRL
jgi:hypothetical protein